MKYSVNNLIGLLAVLGWLNGLVLVKGVWLTIAAIVFPPYAWYVCMERFTQ